MKISLIVILGLISISSFAQTTDTLQNAKAFKNSLLAGGNTPYYGLATNGHIYAVEFIDQFDGGGNRTPLKVARMDLHDGTVTYKTIETINTSGIWVASKDSLGNIYVDISRNIYKFNFKDSIYFKNLGCISLSIGALAYSVSLGRDNLMYFGGSSGGTFLAVYNPYVDTFYRYHDELNAFQDYTTDAVGDDDGWIYAQVGQRDSNEIWAIKKSDASKKILYKCINTTRFSFEIRNTGVYTMGTNGTQLLRGGASTQTTLPVNSHRIAYFDVNDVNNGGRPTAKGFYDASLSNFAYTTSFGDSGHINLTTSTFQNLIKILFFNFKDTDHIYYIGDDYGNYYKYSISGDSSTPLGYSGYNAYSAVQYNDSLMFIGNYPSGTVLRFHLNPITHPFTTQKWNTQLGYLVDGTGLGDNPRVEGGLHSTPADVHHVTQMALGRNGYIGLAGDVIRTNFTASIGTIKPITTGVGTFKGYDASKLIGLGSSDLVAWRDIFIWAASNYYGGHPKLYFYDPETNAMFDSIDAGFGDYGRLYITGDQLTGVAPDLVYKVDLLKRKLISSYSFPANSIGSSLLLSDGRILINTNATLPKNFCCFLKQPYSILNYYEFNKVIYYISNYIIKRVKNLLTIHSENPSFQRLFYLKSQLGL